MRREGDLSTSTASTLSGGHCLLDSHALLLNAEL